ncbi:MAG: TrkA family potassium uptake protein [Chloroflexi bacterium]|nr:TrkA family potassium uptake protein [Chloroflexota bacterium]
MYIIVIGGGKVGYYLTKTLLAEGHEVLVIEKDARKCETIAEELGSIVLRGDGCEVRTLAEAGCNRADMLIAVTGHDEDNLVACQVGKHKFQVPRTVARVNNPKNANIFEILGVETTISSTDLILAHIEHELPTHPLIHLLTLKGIGLEIVELKIPADSAVVGRRIRDIPLPSDSVLALIISKSKGAQVPGGDTVLAVGDEVIAVTKPENEPALRVAFTHT